jgi:predicted component of type VI protein secretion system
MAKRLLADIVNDTDQNESLLYRYALGSSHMAINAVVVINKEAFQENMRKAARDALRIALQVKDKLPSHRRLLQIAVTYEVAPREVSERG